MFESLVTAQPVLLVSNGERLPLATARAAAAHVTVRTLPRSSRADWAAMGAALVRPDGYLAWADDTRGAELDAAAAAAVARLRPMAQRTPSHHQGV